ncbi:hypothetical protein PABG_03034 [Paracoccidioides brasiliensis Pb03]|nr:hypothetical protein PABG_03034 [Paracoccidioides brasiliensis Pb03]
MEREEVPGALAHSHFQDKKVVKGRVVRTVTPATCKYASQEVKRTRYTLINMHLGACGSSGMGKEGAEDVNMDNTYATECLENYPGGYGEENEINAVR